MAPVHVHNTISRDGKNGFKVETVECKFGLTLRLRTLLCQAEILISTRARILYTYWDFSVAHPHWDNHSQIGKTHATVFVVIIEIQLRNKSLAKGYTHWFSPNFRVLPDPFSKSWASLLVKVLVLSPLMVVIKSPSLIPLWAALLPGFTCKSDREEVVIVPG